MIIGFDPEVTDRLEVWKRDPRLFVRECFGVTPDPWQDAVLISFPTNQRQALLACKGPGKTCVLAWLIWNFLITRKNSEVAVTSVTEATLADTIWKELAKWMQRSSYISGLFTWQKTRIFANENPELWYCSARTWSKNANEIEQGQSLAGLHSDYIMFVLDESGSMPDAIMASAEAALSSCVEGHIVQAGNPTQLEGPLYRAATSERRLWHVTEITGDPDDPMRSPRVSIQWAREQIEKYGKDNPYVQVNVFGRFPASSFNSLISLEEVQAAIDRRYVDSDFNKSAKIMGVDVAMQGDDSSVIFMRQGLHASLPMQYRNIDGTTGADIVARKWQEWDADAVFIDNTGGFGSSWLDNLKRLGFAPIPVHFSEKSLDEKFFNKRSQMMFNCVEWIKSGGSIPNIPELTAALVKTTYTHKGSKLLIEPKELVKSKLGYSPDHLDSLMLTFAFPVFRGGKEKMNSGMSRYTSHYDPLAVSYIRQDMDGNHSGRSMFRS